MHCDTNKMIIDIRGRNAPDVFYNGDMKIKIKEISPDRLHEYDCIPQCVEVKTILKVELINQGLGGILLNEVPVEIPYVKDYDASGELPSDMGNKFDIRNWGFFLAVDGPTPVGAATVAMDTTGVFMLEARPGLAVLWDIRVCPKYRGVGIPLFRHAAKWAQACGCTQMKIETQNVNVPACRFYMRMGARLGEIHRFGYAAVPVVADEVMLNWYLDLTTL
jgi:GNAT superfamily N-acetyltransferase